jgi:integral membrane protein
VSTGPPPTPEPDAAQGLRRALDRVRIIAVLDALLLVVLVWAAVTEREQLVDVLGPTHGFGFLLLLWLTAQGAGAGRWGWWFPLVTLVTAGPPGSLLGEMRIRRELRD